MSSENNKTNHAAAIKELTNPSPHINALVQLRARMNEASRTANMAKAAANAAKTAANTAEAAAKAAANALNNAKKQAQQGGKRRTHRKRSHRKRKHTRRH